MGMASRNAYLVVIFIGVGFGFNAGKMASVFTSTLSDPEVYFLSLLMYSASQIFSFA